MSHITTWRSSDAGEPKKWLRQNHCSFGRESIVQTTLYVHQKVRNYLSVLVHRFIVCLHLSGYNMGSTSRYDQFRKGTITMDFRNSSLAMRSSNNSHPSCSKTPLEILLCLFLYLLAKNWPSSGELRFFSNFIWKAMRFSSPRWPKRKKRTLRGEESTPPTLFMG